MFDIGENSSIRNKSISGNLWKYPFTCINKMERTQREDWGKLKKAMDKWAVPGNDIYFQYGFEVLGPLLFGFCKWLHKTVQKQKFEHLFFLSRDGYLLLSAYKTLYPVDEIPVSYLYISRKAAREAQLCLNADLSEVSRLFPRNAYVKCGEFCMYLNIEDNESIHILKECGLTEDTPFLPEDLLCDGRLGNFYEKVKPRVIKNSRKVYSKMIQYLHQNEFCGKVGIVDIGWKGTIQDCLQTIIQSDVDSKCEMTGCYLGLSSETAGQKNKLSFIAPGEEPQEFDAGFVEYPFLAPEGSLLGYSNEPDHTVKPVLADYEYDKESHKIAKNMQDGALYFVECAKESIDGEFTWDAAFSYANLKRISKHPTLKEVNIFGNLAYYDGGKREVAMPKSIGHYLTHMREFPYDLSVSGWRIGFLKRLFKIEIDYNRLLKMYKNRRQMERV